MSSLSRDIVFLLLQFLNEEKYADTVHWLEKESGLFFNLKYFEEVVNNGKWDEAEKYLSGFTKVEDNPYSRNIFFELCKQKYQESLDENDYTKAIEILKKDLIVFSTSNEERYKEMTLLSLKNSRENVQPSTDADAKSVSRAIAFLEIKKNIEENPLFDDKLQFPSLSTSRLQTLLNQSLRWQHHYCKNPKSTPDFRTIFVDHLCDRQQPQQPVSNQLTVSMPNDGGLSLGTHDLFHAGTVNTLLQLSASPGGLMVNTSSVPRSLGLPASNNPGSEHILKIPRRPFRISDEVSVLPVNRSVADLPTTVVADLDQGSSVKSMDFHPVQETLLLVGTNTGDIALWEVGRKERIASRKFETSLVNGNSASVNRVAWSPDGNQFGVAYSKKIVHIYKYNHCSGGGSLVKHLEIQAHAGNVNDIVFSHHCRKKLCVITCGEDKTLKVWDAATGAKLYTFGGHQAPVYRVCPRYVESLQCQYIFSTSIDGTMILCSHTSNSSRVIREYNAVDGYLITMAYSADGKRLFSCGTSKEGDSKIKSWTPDGKSVKCTYLGLEEQSLGVVQFDTAKNKFLAAGHNFLLKFWNMDNTDLLTSTAADGELPASPCVKFSRGGILLAASTIKNGVKILGNSEGVPLIRSIDRAINAIGSTPPNISKLPVVGTHGTSSSAARTGSIGVRNRSSPAEAMVPITGVVTPGHAEELADRSTIWKLSEISEPSEIQSIRLSDMSQVEVSGIIGLIYTHSGGKILAMTSNAQYKVWTWQGDDQNVTAKATTSVGPTFDKSGRLLKNDQSETDLKTSVPCFAVSKNGAYLISAFGGKISLFNLLKFKTMTTFMPPPPAATFLAYHPEDNNILVVGMEDSSIKIYNLRLDEVKSTLKGHKNRITGIAFSSLLKILVSSGADAQICVWSTDAWDRKASKILPHVSRRAKSSMSDTRVQFHQDQTQLLIVHETQIAIYQAPILECTRRWVSGETVTDARYSCDSQSIFASFKDGSVTVLTSTSLSVRCRISSSAYLHSSPSGSVYPLVVAAHPTEVNQFALGLTDGGIVVVEPLDSEGEWGIGPDETGKAGACGQRKSSNNRS